MPTLNNNVYLLEQNTKYPALSHVLSVRVNNSSAGASTTFAIPTTFNNPSQLALAGFAATGQPQQGRRLFVTQLVVRDVAGNLSGAGATGGGSVALLNTTTNQTVATVSSPASATQAPYVVAPVATGTGVVGPQDSLSIVYTTSTGATATATSFTVDIFGYWQQGI